MIGILRYQHLGDQRFGRNPTFYYPRWSRRLDDRALARAAPIAWAARHQYAEGGGDDVQALGNIFADLMERVFAARAGLVVNIDNLFDPLEVRG